MDVSPQLLREVEFREQWRGYNPDEVDDFLERVASALEQLQDRLRETADRAARAERRVTESDDEGELKRTLVLAQRTADAAIQEANREAARLRADAEAQSAALVADARAQAERLTADAEERASRQLGDLSDRRTALEADVEALTSYVSDVRSRLADDLRTQLSWLEDPQHLALRDRPELRGVPVETAPAPETPPPEEAVADDDELPNAHLPGSAELADALRTFEGNGTAEAHPPYEYDELPGPDDESVLADAAADDPFLAELRRAVVDPEPLGPREGDDTELFDDEMASSRFRRRRRP